MPSAEGLAEAVQAEEVARAIVSRWIERGLIAPKGPPERTFALLASVAAGITSIYIANEPHVPLGEGLFGSLVPDAVNLFDAAWAPGKRNSRSRRGARQRAPLKREVADR